MPAFCTPRSDMHRCSASMTTPTPRGQQVVLQAVRDLHREALLNLQFACEQLDDARELRHADDPVTRQVGDVRNPVKWQHVVPAQRVKGDVTHDDELVVGRLVGKVVSESDSCVSISASAAATRRGVSRSPGALRSRPNATSRSWTARSAAHTSIAGVWACCSTPSGHSAARGARPEWPVPMKAVGVAWASGLTPAHAPNPMVRS